MLFWLKKFVSFWLMPLPFCVTAMIVGLVLLRSTRLARLGRAVLTAAVALLILFSNNIVSRALIRPLEARYAPIPEFTPGTAPSAELSACRFVYVLGSGNGNEPNTSANNLLTASALARIIEAVRIIRALPEAKLILSGPGDTPDGLTHAEVLARTAERMGIARDRILKIETARDTEEETREVRKIVGDARFALVTSACHLPRAVALCRGVGLTPLPCPCDFTTHRDDTIHFQDFLWDVESLGRSTAAVRERIGYLWIWLRGKA